MRALLLTAVLGLAIAGGNVHVNASVPLPVIQQASGVSSLAPILKQTMPAVVTIAIRDEANAKNSPQGKSQRVQRTAGTLPAERPLRPSGSGVVIDPRPRP